MLSWSNIRNENEQAVWARLSTAAFGFQSGWLRCLSLIIMVHSPSAIAKGDVLTDFGCYQCHSGQPVNDGYRESQLSLSQIVERFSSSYLEALIGHSLPPESRVAKRLHGFTLSDTERRGVVHALNKRAPPSVDKWPTIGRDTRRALVDSVRDTLTCGGCHGVASQTAALDPLLTRYRFKYAQRRVAAIGGKNTSCRYSDAPLTPAQTTTVIGSVSPLVDSTTLVSPDNVAVSTSALERAQCAACHQGEKTPERYLNLSRMWGYLSPSWTASFLSDPIPVRRTGVVPGDGRRHLDQSLSADEVSQVMKALKRLHRGKTSMSRPSRLPADREAAVKRLISGRYGCTGCHELDGQGGRIGPSFDRIGGRLRAEGIRKVLITPTHYNEQSIMPKWQFSHARGNLDELVSFLAHRKPNDDGPANRYVPWAQLPMPAATQQPSLDQGRALYDSHCAACHGEDGKGNGYNAPFLTAVPMVHWQQSQLAQSTDERLLMGLSLGGWVLGKSGQMPGFGGLLTPEELRAVVSHFRVLCACDGPDWSKDVPQ